jgi:hypothetical protein
LYCYLIPYPSVSVIPFVETTITAIIITELIDS